MNHRIASRTLPLLLAAALTPAVSHARPDTNTERRAPLPQSAILHASAIGVVRASQVNVDTFGMNLIGDAAHQPTIAIDPSAPGRIVVAFRRFPNIATNSAEAAGAWSNDSGRTWHAFDLDPGVARSNPLVRVDSDGTFFFSSRTSAPLSQIFRSTDGGHTWGGPLAAFGADRQWLTIDTTSSLGNGAIYQHWSNSSNPFAPNTFSRSLNGGNSFESPIALVNRPLAGRSAIGLDGQLFISGASATSNSSTFYLLRSSNAFGPAPTFLSSTVAMGGTFLGTASNAPNLFGLLGQVHVGVDQSSGPRRGWVYVLSTVNPASADPADILLARSTDGGVTFSAPIKVNPEPAGPSAWQWFGGLSVAPDGRLDVIYFSTAGISTTQLMFTQSFDGGDTWSTPIQLTNTFDSRIGAPPSNGMGDWQDMESDALGATIVTCATLAGGQDVYFFRVGPDDCNRNGIDDAIDIESGFDPDCNANGIPDSCDIKSGLATDLSHPGIPDGCEPSCPGDFNLDGLVTDADFVVFVYSYNTLLCSDPIMPPGCRADLNSDSAVDDADFALFVSGYNDLVCTAPSNAARGK
ncbi:MAG: hypothetical protein JNK16_15545 [Phycisphaerales bacterium]|nr:hypothetical protein [Phycisphaerales bacterium]